MNAYVSIWDGRGSLPGTSPIGWEQRHGSYLLEHAEDRNPTDRRPIEHLHNCACGGKIANFKWRRGRRLCGYCWKHRHQAKVKARQSAA